ncbi:HTTM domain-containing protein [Streptomyces sp. NPDC004609]|uniref:HTTM domain-containing protein n=1 Tax=Streptomyces sp. NPDC004609 TaxID=3364704 RepID=UPI0036B1D6F7
MSDTSTSKSAGFLQRVTATALGPYQSAVVRIGFALTWLLFLLRELPHRHELYGPDGPWSWEMGRELIAGNDAFTVLMWSDGVIWFEAVYALAVLSSLLLMLGWRTRTMSVLFMVGVLSLQNRSILMGDGGDNVIHLMAVYLVFTRCGRVWSLDARRAARAAAVSPAEPAQRSAAHPSVTGGPAGDRHPDDLPAHDRHPNGTSPAERYPDERSVTEPLAAGAAAGRGAAPGLPEEPPYDRVGPALWLVLGLGLLTATLLNRTGAFFLVVMWVVWIGLGLWWTANRYAPRGQVRILLDCLANLAHNAALLVIMAEVCLIYATAGWYKIQGSRWQDGTALYYPLKLEYFTPWPALSDLLASGGLIVMVLTYVTVIVQVAFPFTLFNRRVKNVLLVVMIMEHAGIAVILGLPFFSMAMIAADAVFLPTVFLVWLGARFSWGRDRLLKRTPGKPPAPDGDPVVPEQRQESPGHTRTLVG